MVQDSRSASYPGAAIASSYDFGSIDFFRHCDITTCSSEAALLDSRFEPARLRRPRLTPRSAPQPSRKTAQYDSEPNGRRGAGGRGGSRVAPRNGDSRTSEISRAEHGALKSTGPFLARTRVSKPIGARGVKLEGRTPPPN
jgi:hypothetical protein